MYAKYAKSGRLYLPPPPPSPSDYNLWTMGPVLESENLDEWVGSSDVEVVVIWSTSYEVWRLHYSYNRSGFDSVGPHGLLGNHSRLTERVRKWRRHANGGAISCSQGPRESKPDLLEESKRIGCRNTVG